MDQQTFLRLAKRELGCSYPGLAKELGLSPRTVEKWSLNTRSPDHRKMPRIAEKFICKLLEEKRRNLILAGNRSNAETIDAILTHANKDKFLDNLRSFDALQLAANALVRMTVAPDKPKYFRHLKEKNAWNEEEEIRNARTTREASTLIG